MSVAKAPGLTVGLCLVIALSTMVGRIATGMLLSDVRKRLLGRGWGSVVVDLRLGGRNAGRRKGLFFFPGEREYYFDDDDDDDDDL